MILLYFALLLYFLYRYRTDRHDRRHELIALICSKGIRSLEWHHRGNILQLQFTSESVAKLSRNRGNGLGHDDGILIKHFWIEGKLHNTDTFSIRKLKFDSSSNIHKDRNA